MSAEVQKQGMIPNLQNEIMRPIQKPSPIVLPPSPSTTLGKRTADELEGDCQEDTSQAGAGDDGDYFSDISSVDFCVCQPPLSAQKPPRPRNSFILYRQYSQLDIDPNLSVPDASKVISDAWNSLSEKEKEPWKRLAEEEKQRHKREHPNYRYQPRKGSRLGRKNSVVETPTSISSKRCDTCGKFSMTNPTTPSPAETNKPNVFPSTPQSASFNPNRQLPPMNTTSLPSPNRRQSTRTHPSNIHIPPISHLTNQHGAGQDDVVSPDQKRRRFPTGSISTPQGQYPQHPVYNTASPFRGSFGQAHHANVSSQERHGGAVPYPQFPQARVQTAQNNQQVHLAHLATSQGTPKTGPDHLLTLPKEQQKGRTLEEIFKGGSVTEQLKVLGRVSQPCVDPPPNEPAFVVRGAAVAVEGDHPQAVQSMVEHLDSHLSRCGEFSVQVAEGPEAPSEDINVSLVDFHDLVVIWIRKGQEMVKYLTSPPNPGSDVNGNRMEHAPHTGSLLPIILLNRYSHFATNAWAARISTEGKYSEPRDHWLWCATMWRGTVTPDFTIYVQDASSEEIANNKSVELIEDLRLILVRKEKGVGEAQWKIDDRTLRRVGFEITEWIRKLYGQQ